MADVLEEVAIKSDCWIDVAGNVNLDFRLRYLDLRTSIGFQISAEMAERPFAEVARELFGEQAEPYKVVHMINGKEVEHDTHS